MIIETGPVPHHMLHIEQRTYIKARLYLFDCDCIGGGLFHFAAD